MTKDAQTAGSARSSIIVSDPEESAPDIQQRQRGDRSHSQIHTRLTRPDDLRCAAQAPGVQDAANDQRRAMDMDQPRRKALQLSHHQKDDRNWGIFGPIGLNPHSFAHILVVAIADRNFVQPPPSHDLQAEPEEKQGQKAGVEGELGSMGHLAVARIDPRVDHRKFF